MALFAEKGSAACSLLCCVAVEKTVGYLFPESKREELQRERTVFLSRGGGTHMGQNIE